MTNLLQRRSANPDLDLPDSLHPLIQRIYSQRAVLSAEELELGLDNLLSPDRMYGMEQAVDLLVDVLQQQKHILIVSDFDVDGATSCALAIKALTQFGAKQVEYIVPNRFEYGYGLTPEIVGLAKTLDPYLLITVDNGTSSIDGVQAAKQAGIKVLITDHHLAAEELPNADAIVNPNLLNCEFPSKCIAGVGVIFYVMLALRTRLRDMNWFADHDLQEPHMAAFLDLVALGTVADVVPLDRNNRILVDEGLKRIRAGRTCPGILALLEVANRKVRQLSASDLGFSLGPRLNAAGRLDDMSTGIECLLAEKQGSAYELALQLDAMNQDRKQIEADMREQAFAYLEELVLEEDGIPPALCVYDPRWHQGVVGILASRIKDRFNRPVIAFAKACKDESRGEIGVELKGSARSIKGFHIRDALDAVACHYPGLITRFGGHAMAAGLSLDKSRLTEFTKAFEEEAARLLSEEQLTATLFSDGEIETDWLSMEIAEKLERAGPWGQEFPEPLFDGRFELMQFRAVGEKHLKMLLSPIGSPGFTVDAIAFNVETGLWPIDDTCEIEIVYRMEVNEFRGNRSLQLVVERILRLH
jgi:single-stranded-DNA-specific exonuclease